MTEVYENRVLAGRYQLLNKLGQGGMGSVWRANDLTLRIQVAVKLIDADIAGSEEALARFQREAFASAQLRSSHIVHITDHGVDGDLPYIAMDLLEGESLAARLRRQGRLLFAEALPILTQIARALTLAHSKGIAHRDLKPDNVFIIRESDVEVTKVLDFGIAKRLDAQSQSAGVKTRTGTLLGTPYYMSPEQARGKTLVDHRTDIWSLGVIAYECLTGRRPFEEQTLAALLLAICSDDPPTPSQLAMVPSGFDEWFARAVSRDLNKRFHSAAEAAQAFAALGLANDERPITSTDLLRTITLPPTTDYADVAQAIVALGPATDEPRVSSPEIAPGITGTQSSNYVETVIPASVTKPGITHDVSRLSLWLGSISGVIAVGAIGYFTISRPTAATAPAAAASASTLLASAPSQAAEALPAAAHVAVVGSATGLPTGVASIVIPTEVPRASSNPLEKPEAKPASVRESELKREVKPSAARTRTRAAAEAVAPAVTPKKTTSKYADF